MATDKYPIEKYLLKPWDPEWAQLQSEDMTSPIHQTIDDRWSILMTDVFSSNAEDTTSALYDGLSAGVREALGRIVRGVEGDDEYQVLCEAEEAILAEIEDRVKAFGVYVYRLRTSDDKPAVSAVS